MHLPERRAMQRHPFDQDPLATVRADQRRPQEMLYAIRIDAVHALSDRRHERSQRPRDGALLLEPETIDTCGVGKSDKGPPIRRARLSVQNARGVLSGDGDVRLAEGIDKRRIVEYIVAFPRNFFICHGINNCQILF